VPEHHAVTGFDVLSAEVDVSDAVRPKISTGLDQLKIPSAAVSEKLGIHLRSGGVDGERLKPLA
jgi:hypothetical protein